MRKFLSALFNLQYTNKNCWMSEFYTHGMTDDILLSYRWNTKCNTSVTQWSRQRRKKVHKNKTWFSEFHCHFHIKQRQLRTHKQHLFVLCTTYAHFKCHWNRVWWISSWSPMNDSIFREFSERSRIQWINSSINE